MWCSLRMFARVPLCACGNVCFSLACVCAWLDCLCVVGFACAWPRALVRLCASVFISPFFCGVVSQWTTVSTCRCLVWAKEPSWAWEHLWSCLSRCRIKCRCRRCRCSRCRCSRCSSRSAWPLRVACRVANPRTRNSSLTFLLAPSCFPSTTWVPCAVLYFFCCLVYSLCWGGRVHTGWLKQLVCATRGWKSTHYQWLWSCANVQYGGHSNEAPQQNWQQNQAPQQNWQPQTNNAPQQNSGGGGCSIM